MGQEYEQYRDNILRLSEWYEFNKSTRNEATTRLHLIDSLLFECLGWKKEDTVLEEHYDGQYTDYTFRAPRSVLIVEAKKEGDYFEVPSGKTNFRYSIKSLIKDFPNVKLAIEQVAKYCQDRGVPVGAICNGHQVIAFIANRNDGLPPFEGDAFVFPSLSFMHENFIQLWEALSKPSIEDKKIQSKLLGDSLPVLPPKLSSSITPYPGVKNRNIFQTDLQLISDLVIEDVTRSRGIEKKFLEECYCQSGALSQYSVISKEILKARYVALFDESSESPTVTPAVQKDGISSDLISETLSGRPILLIGDTGVGKTSFILNLIHVEASSIFDKSVVFYVDLGTKATLTDNIKDFIVDDIISQLLNEHSTDIFEKMLVRGIYHSELKRFSKGIYSDLKVKAPDKYLEEELDFLGDKIKNKEEHLKSALMHMSKSWKKQLIFIIDNADQRDEEVQQESFLISQEFAKHWPVMVFVALRPETFHRSMQIGALSGYHPKAFTISPPRIDLVLEKRLAFALKLTSGEIPISQFAGSLKLEKLDAIIRAFIMSLDYNEDLKILIDNISGGNVRLALDLVKNFFGSGHVDTKKIVDKFIESKKYYIPIHEFLRAVIYGDAIHYDSQQSVIANIFDLHTCDPKEHFLMPILLSLLEAMGKSSVEKGFVETASLYEKLQGFGFTPDQIDMAIVRCYRKKLLETSARIIPQPGKEMPQTIRINSSGLYHAHVLSKDFNYIDAMVVDTTVLDSKYRENLLNVEEVNKRLERAKVFCDYLDSAWELISDAENIFNWPIVCQELKLYIDEVTERVKKAMEQSNRGN